MPVPTKPGRGEIHEGYHRALHTFLRSFFKDVDTVVEINGTNYTFPGGMAIEFTVERLDAGQNVIAFLGEKLKGTKRHKTTPINGVTPTHPFAYEDWSSVHQLVYVKVSENKQNVGQNFRQATRIYDLLVLVFSVFARDFFSDKGIDAIEISTIPANLTNKDYNVLVGNFESRIKVKFEPQQMPTP